MRRVPGVWAGRVLVALLLGAAVDLALSELNVAHDNELVVLLALATIAAAVLAQEAVDATARLPWVADRPDRLREDGEDTATAAYRHVVEVHLTSRTADDAIVWQLADLARQRLRQVHGFRPEDDPDLAIELLGPQLGDWVTRDRRERYRPDQRQRRFTVGELGEALVRIEQL